MSCIHCRCDKEGRVKISFRGRRVLSVPKLQRSRSDMQNEVECIHKRRLARSLKEKQGLFFMNKRDPIIRGVGWKRSIHYTVLAESVIY